VCLFLQTRLDVSHWNSNSTNNFFSYMKDVLLESIFRQCKDVSACPELKAFHWFIVQFGANNELYTFLKYLSKVIDLHVIRGDKPQSRSSIKLKVNELFLKHNCEWLMLMWIDADDAFMDGYFNYVTTVITKKLLQTTTEDGLAWRGAVFGLRYIPELVVGMNRCNFNKHDDPKESFTCGWSQGQGFIMKRDVWESLHRNIFYRTKHGKFLNRVREFVMNKLGVKKWKSKMCVGEYIRWYRTKEQIDDDLKEAAETQIMFFDVSLEKITSPLYILTPFSSHFPWDSWRNLTVCDEEQINAIQQEYPQDIRYILKNSRTINMTEKDACMNSLFVHHHKEICSGYKLTHWRLRP